MDIEKPTLTEQPTSTDERTGRGIVRDLLETIVPAMLIAVLINVFLAQSTIVYGQSMEPNLFTEQRLVIEKVSYHMHGPQRGDVIVLRDPTHGPLPLIKRVIGLSGERVTIANGRVFIDGAPLDEPYLNQETWGAGRSWLVPPLHVFVMGDNRSDSLDSRTFGPAPIDQVLGHAVLRYWPPGRAGLLR